jgi:hypothetical protein
MTREPRQLAIAETPRRSGAEQPFKALAIGGG